MLAILLRVTAFCVLVAIAQVFVGPLTRPDTVMHLERILHRPPDVLLLGNSTTFAYAAGRSTGESIGGFLSEEIGALAVEDYSYVSSQLIFYEAVARYLAEAPRVPRTVVVPINLSAFSPGWDRNPAWQWKGHIYAMETAHDARRYFLKPAAAFGLVRFTGPESQAEYEAIPVVFGGRRFGTVGNVREFGRGDIDTAVTFAAALGGEVSDTHRMLASITEIQRLFSSRGVRVLYYISPVDHETARSVLGDDFDEAWRRNRKVVEARLRSVEADYVDLSSAVPSSGFSHIGTAPEHLAPEGVRVVAAALAARLRSSKVRSASALQ
jgi:hypothetical protein